MLDGGSGDVDVVQERGALALVRTLDKQPGVACSFGGDFTAAGLFELAGVGTRCEPGGVWRGTGSFWASRRIAAE
jgi:hypothetical protein